MSKFIREFKEFAVKGNAIDMAVGVIIGAAFGKIVSSIVSDIIMPPIGWLIGGVDFSDLKVQMPVLPLPCLPGMPDIAMQLIPQHTTENLWSTAFRLSTYIHR